MTRYVISKQANLDLNSIWEYVAIDNADAADKVYDALEAGMEKLAQMPGIGHPRDDVANSDYLVFKVHSYLIVYRPKTRPLEIVRVIHGARDIRKIFPRN